MQDTHAATNGIDTVALADFIAGVAADPARAGVRFDVLSTWQGGTRSRAVTQPMLLGQERIERSFAIEADEPPQLLGADQAPNPQELLMAALNACMTVGYVANAAAMGIRLDDLQIRTSGRLDLRGFLGLDATVNPGYDEVRYEVSIKSPASDEQLQALHAHVQKTSPNYHNFARPITLHATLSIGH